MIVIRRAGRSLVYIRETEENQLYTLTVFIYLHHVRRFFIFGNRAPSVVYTVFARSHSIDVIVRYIKQLNSREYLRFDMRLTSAARTLPLRVPIYKQTRTGHDDCTSAGLYPVCARMAHIIIYRQILRKRGDTRREENFSGHRLSHSLRVCAPIWLICETDDGASHRIH